MTDKHDFSTPINPKQYPKQFLTHKAYLERLKLQEEFQNLLLQLADEELLAFSKYVQADAEKWKELIEEIEVDLGIEI